MLKSCKLASSNNRRRKEDEERKKAKTDQDKARSAEQEEDERKFMEKYKKKAKGDGDILAKKEKDHTECRKVTDELFSEGNTLLTKAIKEKHFTDAAVAEENQWTVKHPQKEVKHPQIVISVHLP